MIFGTRPFDEVGLAVAQQLESRFILNDLDMGDLCVSLRGRKSKQQQQNNSQWTIHSYPFHATGFWGFPLNSMSLRSAKSKRALSSTRNRTSFSADQSNDS